jgi:hypothetical protein
MNKQQAIESLARLNKEGEELKKYIEGCDKDVLWRPKYNETYFIIKTGETSSYINKNDNYDNKIIATGEYWQTREEAQAELDKRLAIQRVIVWIAENLGYDSRKWADFKEENKKHSFYYHHSDEINEIRIENYEFVKIYSPTGYLKSREDAEKIIESCKSDLELIYK